MGSPPTRCFEFGRGLVLGVLGAFCLNWPVDLRFVLLLAYSFNVYCVGILVGFFECLLDLCPGQKVLEKPEDNSCLCE